MTISPSSPYVTISGSSPYMVIINRIIMIIITLLSMTTMVILFDMCLFCSFVPGF